MRSRVCCKIRVYSRVPEKKGNRQNYCIILYWLKEMSRSQRPRGLRRGSAATRLLGLRVLIPPGSFKDLCVGLITHS
jgi:hypothetical protein